MVWPPMQEGAVLLLFFVELTHCTHFTALHCDCALSDRVGCWTLAAAISCEISRHWTDQETVTTACEEQYGDEW